MIKEQQLPDQNKSITIHVRGLYTLLFKCINK